MYQQGCKEAEELIVTRIDTNETCTFKNLRSGRNMILDFWTLSCTKCPSALTTLNRDASKHKDILHVSCLLLKEEEVNIDAIQDVTQDFKNLLHVHMSIPEKEKAKRLFSFSSVPFSVAMSNYGILYSGPPLDSNSFEFLDDQFILKK